MKPDCRTPSLGQGEDEGTVLPQCNHLFIFGGAFPKTTALESVACSNTLYIFNSEYEIWYQPIVEEKPLPRLG